jgi:hypothetical protein
MRGQTEQLPHINNKAELVGAPIILTKKKKKKKKMSPIARSTNLKKNVERNTITKVIHLRQV